MGCWATGVSSGAQEFPVIAGLEHHTNVNARLAGDVLLSELNCTACHGTEFEHVRPKGGPELSRVAERVNPAFLTRLIAETWATKPGTTMPDVLAHLPEGERLEVARAITHYLVSLRPETPSVDLSEKISIERGKELYHSVGCVACHSPEDPVPGSVPLGPVHEKYGLAGLVSFLKDPLSARPGGRMPALRLDHWEAVGIAGYLLRDGEVERDLFEVDPVLASRGKTLFEEHRCAACHAVEGKRQAASMTRLDRLRTEEGCLSGNPGPWPRYRLAPEQRRALGQAVSGPGRELSVEERIELTLTRLNCIACHTRGAYGGVPEARDSYFATHDPNLGEQGRLPPSLSLAGAKLKRDWLERVLVHGESVRPYMKTRMPRFGEANVAGLADLLKQADRQPARTFDRIADGKEARNIGRRLVGDRGLSCVTCHTFRLESAAPIRVTDLTLMTERLEEDWFHAFLPDPQKFQPRTIMPTFFPGGKSLLTDVLDGNMEKQIDAIWQYLSEGGQAGQPSGLVLEPLELEVKDEAVILRRSYPGIGKRGIGVGYPNGISLSFDAGQMRLGSIWSGGFIEASGVWRGQGSGMVRPLGRKLVRFPEGPAFAVLESLGRSWPAVGGRKAEGFQFKGYTLDALRRPTFEYEFLGRRIEDRFLDERGGDGEAYFRRELMFPEGLATGTFFRVIAEREIEELGERDYRAGKSTRIVLSEPGRIREAGEGGMELLVPLENRRRLTVEYHW